MSPRLAELQLMLGESRRRLGLLAERVGEVRRRIEPADEGRYAAGAGASGSRPFAEAIPGADEVEDIDDLDLKFEALVVEGADQEKLPES